MICFKCVSCQVSSQSPRRFKSQLKLLGHEAQTLDVETDCSLVPGTIYELFIKGMWVGPNSVNSVGVGDLEKAAFNGNELNSVTIEELAKHQRAMGIL